MIPKPLRLLIWLQTKGLLRQFCRSAKTRNGAMLILVCLGFIGLVAVPNIFAMLFVERDPEQLVRIAKYIPLLLLGLFVMSLISRLGRDGLYFFPEEIENLFPAPFTRRELLTYKLSSILRISFLSAFVSLFVFGTYFLNPICAVIGMGCTYLFSSLVPLACTILGQIGFAHAFTRGRKVFAFLLLGAIGFAAVQASMNVVDSTVENFSDVSPGDIQITSMLMEVDQWVTRVSNSTAGKIILAPFKVFADLMFSKSIDGQFLLNLVLASLMNVLLLAIILGLNANYLSVVERTSKKVADFHKQTMSGGGFAMVGKKEFKRGFPMPPFWHGMGPLLWRQCLATIRTTKAYVFGALILLGAMAIPMLMESKTSFTQNAGFPGIVLVSVGYMTIFFTMAAPVGFRADITRMEIFKCLPMNPAPIAMGQLLGSVIILSVIQLAILGLFAIFLPQWIVFWSAGFAAILPVNFLSLSVANSIVLFFPAKASEGPKDFAAVAQRLVSIVVLMFVLGALIATVCGLGFLTYFLTESWLATIAAALIVAVIFCIASSLILIYAYRRFDVSLHTPA